MADHKNKRYYFESTRSPTVFWVGLMNLDLTVGSPVKRLTLTDGAVYAGNAAMQFRPAEPFKFLEAAVK